MPVSSTRAYNPSLYDMCSKVVFLHDSQEIFHQGSIVCCILLSRDYRTEESEAEDSDEEYKPSVELLGGVAAVKAIKRNLPIGSRGGRRPGRPRKQRVDHAYDKNDSAKPAEPKPAEPSEPISTSTEEPGTSNKVEKGMKMFLSFLNSLHN